MACSAAHTTGSSVKPSSAIKWPPLLSQLMRPCKACAICSLCAGGTLIICPAYDPEKILDCIERERVTYMLLLPPTTYLRLSEYPGTAGRDRRGVAPARRSGHARRARSLRRRGTRLRGRAA